MTEAYPLYWPEHRPRTPSHKRQRSRFETGFGIAVRRVVEELQRLGARNPILSTNVALRRDGLPLASTKHVDDTGVAVYFTYKNKQTCFACDRWDKVEDNIYAIAKTIDALRGIERWGSGDMLDAAFSGFAALPPPSAKREWWDVLQCRQNTSLDFARMKYQELAKIYHPDMSGGNSEKMQELNDAINEARSVLK